MLKASLASGTQVIWDICHWGVPGELSPFDRDFIPRLERFATAVARLIAEHSDTVPFFCPINEISFWSWIGGDRGVFFPYAERRGTDLKRQLASAAVAATRALRSVHPQTRILHCEPIIQIAPNPNRAADALAAERHTEAQFEAWDMIAGRLAPELGGSEDCLDILGCNYYWNNQWQDHGEVMPIGHAQHRPLHELLVSLNSRYGRPIIVSETGVEDGAAIGWLGLICAEAREAMRLGVKLEGICLYPVMDYPGWDDGRHCPCGLIDVSPDWRSRAIRIHLAADLELQREYFNKVQAAAKPTL